MSMLLPSCPVYACIFLLQAYCSRGVCTDKVLAFIPKRSATAYLLSGYCHVWGLVLSASQLCAQGIRLPAALPAGAHALPRRLWCTVPAV